MQGLADLKSRLLRTPLQPLTTFQDDPLRVLRAIRFAARLGFSLVPELEEAIKHPSVKVSVLGFSSESLVWFRVFFSMLSACVYSVIPLSRCLGGHPVFLQF